MTDRVEEVFCAIVAGRARVRARRQHSHGELLRLPGERRRDHVRARGRASRLRRRGRAARVAAGITLRYDDKSVAEGPAAEARLARGGRGARSRSTTQLLLESAEAGIARKLPAQPRLRRRRGAAVPARLVARRVGPLSVHLQQQKFSRNDIVDAGLAFVNKANKLQDQFRARLMFPIYDTQGRAGGLRRPRARRRRPEVQELARDADLPEEPAAVRPQLGEGRDRRARARSSSARATPT